MMYFQRRLLKTDLYSFAMLLKIDVKHFKINKYVTYKIENTQSFLHRYMASQVLTFI